MGLPPDGWLGLFDHQPRTSYYEPRTWHLVGDCYYGSVEQDLPRRIYQVFPTYNNGTLAAPARSVSLSPGPPDVLQL